MFAARLASSDKHDLDQRRGRDQEAPPRPGHDQTCNVENQLQPTRPRRSEHRSQCNRQWSSALPRLDPFWAEIIPPRPAAAYDFNTSARRAHHATATTTLATSINEYTVEILSMTRPRAGNTVGK